MLVDVQILGSDAELPFERDRVQLHLQRYLAEEGPKNCGARARGYDGIASGRTVWTLVPPWVIDRFR